MGLFHQGICLFHKGVVWGVEEESLMGCIFLGGWFFRALVILVLVCCGFIYLGCLGCPGIFLLNFLPSRP